MAAEALCLNIRVQIVKKVNTPSNPVSIRPDRYIPQRSKANSSYCFTKTHFFSISAGRCFLGTRRSWFCFRFGILGGGFGLVDALACAPATKPNQKLE